MHRAEAPRQRLTRWHSIPNFSDNPSLDFEVSSLFDLEGAMTLVGEAFFGALERCQA